MMLRAAGLVVACGGLLLSGCATGANARLEIGTGRTATFATADRGPGMRADVARPRGSWSVSRVVVPIDGVVHGVVRWRDRPIGRKPEAWAVGTYPVLGEGREPVGDHAWDLVGGLGRAAGDVAWWPVRLFGSHERQRWSPRTVWKRTPGGRARAGTVAPRGRSDPGLGL